ncbi:MULTISPECIES: hypothetical protein [unclassified Micromonospora]|uniref:hypothetical protein n=1 Tax=unclassified Micromonospora TaxID=2617518 RepID=UPI00249C4993|nr:MULTISPECIES: hypothetical protein [unclassified Micromonospora]WFE54466.1 hypothetical protein O7617_30810 [Micromonospora sp. WMMD1155]WFE99008.1 hypothetical protein O7616_19070 [Micromonospora sp. WMMD964]
MSDDTSNRPSRSAERPHDVTDPLLWQLAIDVLDAHEPDDEGHCHNLQCAGQAWPCAARQGAEHSLRLSRGAAEPVEMTIDGLDAGTEATPASRWGRNAGPAASRRAPRASASAA